MRSERSIRLRLSALEKEMTEQAEAIQKSEKGYGGPESLFWDGRCVERKALHWILKMKHEPFNAADCMAGW